MEHGGRTYGEVDAGVTGGTGVAGGTEVTGRAVYLAAQVNTWIPGHLLSALYAYAWKEHIGGNLKPFSLSIDSTPNPVLFLSFFPDG